MQENAKQTKPHSGMVRLPVGVEIWADVDIGDIDWECDIGPEDGKITIDVDTLAENPHILEKILPQIAASDSIRNIMSALCAAVQSYRLNNDPTAKATLYPWAWLTDGHEI